MAAIENLRQLKQSHNSTELIVPRHGVVTLFGNKVEVRVERGHLVLLDGIGPNRRYARLPRVGHGLKRLIVIGSNGLISLAAFRWMSDQDVSFSMLERNGKVLAVTGPVRPSDAKLRRSQGLAHSTGIALRIARELISQKLHAQERVVRLKLLDSTTADAIARFRAELSAAQTIASIRLIEAQGAGLYWGIFRTLSVNFPKNDLHRVPDHWRSFGARISPLTGSPRLAANPVNAILNYLYALLESEARLAAAALGLDPGLGVLHVDAPRDSLAMDILEPIRPQVDAYEIDWVTRQPLRREWFFEERSGNCRLMGSFAKQLSETVPTWARAVAPIAEWVAQAFWHSPKSSTKAATVPTRLTQRRRSEGRGRQYVPPTNVAPSPQTICQNCGVLTLGSRHCRKCGKEVSGKKLTELAKVGRTIAVGPEAQKKRSDTQHKHEAAKRAWRESPDENWNDPKRYDTEIKPRLGMVKIAAIALALGVSESYAADIRAGRRRPHPRHWAALAALVKVTAPV
jgi:CRISPR-associated endonuclease Cas1